MDTRDIRRLLRDGHSVVLVEEGQTPLVVTELKAPSPPTEEVPIASRWPKGLPVDRQGRSVIQSRQDQVLERLNKEILALKAQISQEEGSVPEEQQE